MSATEAQTIKRAVDSVRLFDRLPPQRRVVCAAIRAYDGSVLVGVRHYSPDMLAQITDRLSGWKFKHRSGADQGFVDQYGVFMTREEAYVVAFDAKQIVRPEACGPGPTLYSEGLY